MDPGKENENRKQELHEDLAGFDIRINEFGEMTTNINIDEINAFLNTHLADRKLHNLPEEEEEEE
jgi:hypothetical protein